MTRIVLKGTSVGRRDVGFKWHKPENKRWCLWSYVVGDQIWVHVSSVVEVRYGSISRDKESGFCGENRSGF